MPLLPKPDSPPVPAHAPHRAARALAALAAAFACGAQSPAPAVPPPLGGDQILAQAKLVFRSYPRPPFVAYTLVRRDRHNGAPDFENSYTLKIWCRTSDRSALARRAWNGKAYGELQNITVMFDREVDPGPPTADMFEKRLFGAASARVERPGPAPFAPNGPTPSAPAPNAAAGEPASPLPEIGRVSALDGDYRAVRVARDGELLHLWLVPKSDPERNRLDEMWVDARTYDLRRALVRDHLYLGLSGQSLEDEFDVRFTPGPGGLPLITSIHGRTAGDQFETDYTFKDVRFPDVLPDWYFAPKQYGLHRADAPA
ncbi:MAG TPA: hypothetical protein VFF00_07435 [Candidatus Elarobacter sp.]|nr:hypothetical protein [Dongiaceae bacterium]HZW53850.1 hypothetical protein [Candidatus Elarobacter sp.]